MSSNLWSIRFSFFRFSLRFNPIAFGPSIQRAPAQAERLRRVRDAAVSADRPANETRLDALEPHVLVTLRTVLRTSQSKIAWRHRRSCGHQHRALDRVLELAHIS